MRRSRFAARVVTWMALPLAFAFASVASVAHGQVEHVVVRVDGLA